jgi:hypothetical protein
MAQTNFNTSTGEGSVNSGDQGSWATAKGLTSGTAAADIVLFSSKLSPTSFFILRGFVPFDTSSLPNNAVVTAAVLRLYRDDAINVFSNADSTSVEIVPSTQASNTVLANGDFDAVTFSSKGSINLASTTNNAYNDISLTDLSQVSLTGYTKLALVLGRDLNNSAPTGQNNIAFQDRADANPPILRVTYTVPSGGSFIMNFI